MAQFYEVAKYQNKWSVFDRESRTFSFIGKGKKFCENKVKELNNKQQL